MFYCRFYEFFSSARPLMVDIHPHLKNIDHVIWDWNGTLFNDMDTVMVALSQIMTKYSLKPLSREQYLEHFGFPIVDFYKKVGFNLTDVDFNTVSEEFHKVYAEHIHLSQIFTGAENTLSLVKKLNLKQSVLTAAFQNHIEYWLNKYNLEKYFDHVFGLSDKLAHSKMARGEELMRASGSTPERTLLLGDTDHDLEVGQHLGVKVILLTQGHQCPQRLKAKHKMVLHRKTI